MDKKSFWDISRLVEKWQSLKKLVRDKEYKVSPLKKFIYVASLLYVVSPFDFVPEYFTPLGFIDDVGALILLFIHIFDEIEKYEHHLMTRVAGKGRGKPAKKKAEERDKTTAPKKEGRKAK
jgi:uncharacterized membrane protein YkvA (DUF1232 family)